MNNLTWSEVYKHRFEWAKSAHSKFMLNFDNDLYSTHEIKDQIFVAVYGASQVGKTSLILELIGVLPEHHSTVQNVLRADRDYGRSATATVVRYRASSDNYWHIHDVSESSNDRKNLNKNQAKKVLAKIRSDMEVMGDQYNVEEIDISIPEEYLSKKSDRYKDIVIRDLPGVKAENNNEREFVTKAIKDKIEKADLVLLVTTIDNIGLVVQPENLELDELQKWRVNPQRFKIVFTKFYSDDSSLRLCNQLHEQEGSINKNDIRTHIQEQIYTLDNDWKWDVKSQLYALEVGDSWYKLLTEHSEETQSLKKIRDGFFDELKDVIYSASSPIIRLCHGYQIGEISKNFKLEKNQEINIDLNRLEKEIKKINKEIKNIDISIDNHQESIDYEKKYTSNRVAYINDLYNNYRSKISHVSIKKLSKTIREPEKQNTSMLADYLLKNIIIIEDEWELIKRDSIGSIDIRDFPYLSDIDSMQSRLKNYTFQTYFFKENYSNDLKKIKYIIDKQLSSMNESLKNSYLECSSYIRTEGNKKIKYSNNTILKLKNRKRDLVKRRYMLYRKKSNLEEKLDRFNYERDVEIEYSKKFSEFVHTEFKLAISYFSNLAKEESDNMAKLYWIMLIRQLNIDFKIVEGKNDRKN